MYFQMVYVFPFVFPDSHLILDETVLEEGQLDNTGTLFFCFVFCNFYFLYFVLFFLLLCYIQGFNKKIASMNAIDSSERKCFAKENIMISI